VAASFAAVRSSANFSLTAPILIDPYVPTATANAPTNNNTLEISYQKLAASRETSNIANLAILGFVSLGTFWLPIVMEKALRKGVSTSRNPVPEWPYNVMVVATNIAILSLRVPCCDETIAFGGVRGGWPR
jgi:hypothetical protein